jgi:hypothetical protein
VRKPLLVGWCEGFGGQLVAKFRDAHGPLWCAVGWAGWVPEAFVVMAALLGGHFPRGQLPLRWYHSNAAILSSSCEPVKQSVRPAIILFARN